jgi:putative DNA primase/helicase
VSEADDVLSRLEGVRRSGDGWVARCPCHDDREPSLSIGEGDDGRLLLKCFAGCSFEELRGALGLDSPTGNGSKPIEVCRYHYLDEDGSELYSKIRFSSPKRFLREPKGVTSSLYHLELLPYVDSGTCLYLSESEKDAEAALALSRFEVVAVSSGGASTW